MLGEMGIVCAARVFAGSARVPRVISTFRRLREDLRDGDDSEPLERRQYTAVARQLQCSTDTVERIVQEWMYDRPLKWLPYCRRAGVSDLLDWLAARGVSRGILSDYPADSKLVALGIRHQFDVVLSAVDPDIGVFKPHPRGFLAAAERFGVRPEQVVYVGDRLDVDAAGAAAAGMRCAVLSRRPIRTPDLITFRHFEQLKSVLASIC